MTRAAGFAPNTVIEIASLTDVGRTRQANEDCCETFLRADGTRLLVVADGMGGHRGGATASHLAVTTLGQCFDAAVGTPPEAMLTAAIRAANAAIYAEALADPELRGMGTTVVALTVSHAGEAAIAHVGDSRAYRLRSEQLEALTLDHSVVAEMQMRGLITDEQAAVHPRRNEILRSVGVSPEVEVDVTQVEIEVGDQLILCSDGLTGVVADAEIRAILLRSSPDEAVARLVEAANSAGGPDNVTVQIFSLRPRQANEDPDATGPIQVDRTRLEATRAITPPRGIDPRLRQITLAITLASLLTAAYFFYQAFRSDDLVRAAVDRPAADRTQAEDAGAAPREGIPRDARTR